MEMITSLSFESKCHPGVGKNKSFTYDVCKSCEISLLPVTIATGFRALAHTYEPVLPGCHEQETLLLHCIISVLGVDNISLWIC
jgi:hypothetical protein